MSSKDLDWQKVPVTHGLSANMKDVVGLLSLAPEIADQLAFLLISGSEIRLHGAVTQQRDNGNYRLVSVSFTGVGRCM